MRARKKLKKESWAKSLECLHERGYFFLPFPPSSKYREKKKERRSKLSHPQSLNLRRCFPEGKSRIERSSFTRKKENKRGRSSMTLLHDVYVLWHYSFDLKWFNQIALSHLRGHQGGLSDGWAFKILSIVLYMNWPKTVISSHPNNITRTERLLTCADAAGKKEFFHTHIAIAIDMESKER